MAVVLVSGKMAESLGSWEPWTFTLDFLCLHSRLCWGKGAVNEIMNSEIKTVCVHRGTLFFELDDKSKAIQLRAIETIG